MVTALAVNVPNVPQCPAATMLTGWDIAHPAALGGLRPIES